MENKKLRAAIMGVVYYLQEEEKERAKKKINRWSRFGRETIMKNRMQVQSHASVSFDLKRYK